MENNKVDKWGNIVGDGSCHVPYQVFDIEGANVRVVESSTTESVYVYYELNGRIAKVRYSHHLCNDVVYGDVIDGNDPIAALLVKEKLGLVETELVPIYERVRPIRNVAKSKLSEYEVADITEEEFDKLPIGSDISHLTGKILKGTNFLVSGTYIGQKVVGYRRVAKRI